MINLSEISGGVSSQLPSLIEQLIKSKDQLIQTLQEHLKKNDEKQQELLKNSEAKWQERLHQERQALEEIRESDVKRVQEKYEWLLSEIKGRAERAEKRLREKEKEWLGMFKDLYQLSKVGEISKMKTMVEETLSKQASPDVSVPQSPDPNIDFNIEEKQPTLYQQSSNLTRFQEQHFPKIKPKKAEKTLEARTPNGSNRELKEKRSDQTAFIAKILEEYKENLPTIQQIIEGVWSRFEESKELELRPLGQRKSFCDGVGVPRTRLTATIQAVKNLFADHGLRIWTVISKQNSWFVKLDEDAMPDFKTVKRKLKELSASANEKLGGKSEFFIMQVDETKEYQGFLYAKEVKEASKIVKQFAQIGLSQQKGYRSNSLSLNFNAGENRRLKIYNKTVHPLFAADSVIKKVGMGGKQFFQSSHYFYSRSREAEQTGRLRIELSTYLKSKESEVEWFKSDTVERIHGKVSQYLREHGTSFIKEIPFSAVWDAFWGAPKAHIFIEETHKAAIIYARNTETGQYVGGLLDITSKKDMELFHKEHSVVNREAIVVGNGVVVERFIKEENKHCFPIFPRFKSYTTQHNFNIEGWDYYMDCKNVKLRHLSISRKPSVDLQSQQSLFFEGVGASEQITVQQVMVGEPLHAEVLSQALSKLQDPSNMILANRRPVFVAQQEAERVEERKREQKEEAKRIAKAAKQQSRANRDEDMDFFAIYYNEKFLGTQFKDFKKAQRHPKRVQDMFGDVFVRKRMSKFVRNCLHRNKR